MTIKPKSFTYRLTEDYRKALCFSPRVINRVVRALESEGQGAARFERNANGSYCAYLGRLPVGEFEWLTA